MTTLIKKILLLPATCLIPFLTGCNNCPSTTIVEDIIDPAIYTSLPFKMDKVEQPTFPDYSVNIIDFGAKPDGITLNTKAINDAIQQVNAKGGGKVIIPEGLWLTGLFRSIEQCESIYRKECVSIIQCRPFTISHYKHFF